MADQTAERGNDLDVLSRLLADRLRQDQETVCFLLGSGMVVPCVPGVAVVVERAKAWLAADGNGQGPAEMSSSDPPPPAGPEDYGTSLRNIVQRFQADGQRAFVQSLALDAYHGEDADDLRTELALTHHPLDKDRFAELVSRLDDWRVPTALESLAEIVKRHERLPPYIFTTNFDPLITVALRRVGLKVRPVSAATDFNVEADHAHEREITVLHLHGDCYAGITLHTAEELKRDRHQLWQWLTEYLRSKNLFVAGYSGWDDIVRTCLDVVLRPGGNCNVAWPVLDRDEAALGAVHPHLVRLLQQHTPQALAYYGVDRDKLFGNVLGDVLDRVSPNGPVTEPASQPTTAVQVLREQFRFGKDGAVSATPKVLFWPHRLRRPHLLHGVHALAAAALARDGVEVELHLDDIGVEPDQADELIEELTCAVTAWFKRAGVSAGPTVLRYSQQLDLTTTETRSELWGVVEQINQASTTLRELLSAAKVINPRAFDAPPDQYAEYLIPNLDGRVDGRLLRPILNFQILRRAIERHKLAGVDANAGGSGIVTLGGADERPMWTLWQQTFHGSPTGHLFVPRLDTWPKWRLWNMRPLLRASDYGASDLESFLLWMVQREGDHAFFLQWIWDCGIRLWSWIDQQQPTPVMRVGDREIASPEDVVSVMNTMPAQAARALAKGIGEWFYAGL
jgi:SIR2-like domain